MSKLETTTPASQLVKMFSKNLPTPEQIKKYNDALACLPLSAFSTQKPRHTATGFNITGQDTTRCPDHLLLPLVDAKGNIVNTAMIPPPDDKDHQAPIVFEPLSQPKGAFAIGTLTDSNTVFLVKTIEAGCNIYRVHPQAFILVCFTPANIAYMAGQWQFKAKGRLCLPIGCHELDDYQAMLVDATIAIHSLDYDLDFLIPDNEVKGLLANAAIHNLGTLDGHEPLTNEQKQTLSWQIINEKEPFTRLIDENGTPNPYPLDALPELARHAVTAIAHHVQAPIAMAGQCVMGALSYLAQPHVNAYDRYSNKGQPCSLFILTEGGSGERKSSCQRLADQRIYERQQTMMSQYHEDVKDHTLTIAKCRSAKEKADLENNHPEPHNPQSLFKDATLEPIISTFIRGDAHNVAWVSDEAGQIFGGHTLKGDTRDAALGTLTSLWDKGTAERTRARSNLNESGTAYEVRLTINTLGQKAVLEGVLSDPVLREQGFLPRFLFAAPASLAGTRLHNDLASFKMRPFNDKRLVQYWERCNELLDKPFIPPQEGRITRPVMPMSQEAEVMLMELNNTTERQMGKAGRYAHFKPFASRACEHATRVSTILAFFEGMEAVDGNLMQSAIKLVQYSLDEWERYSGFIERDHAIIEADRLENWLLAYCRENDTRTVPRASILQRVTPMHLRKAKALDKVLKILTDQSHARQIKVDGKAHIEINPILFTEK